MAEILVYTLGHSHRFDVVNMALLFLPGSKIAEDAHRHTDVRLFSQKKELPDGKVFYYARLRFCGKTYSAQKKTVPCDDERDLMIIKQTVYRVFLRATGIRPPWGILTGIRPMAIYEKLIGRRDASETKRVLTHDYFLTEKKADLLAKIYRSRTPAYDIDPEQSVSLYISIPFCPSKCKYCSFVSSSVEKTKHLLEPYFTLLMQELSEKLELLHRAGKTISSVYIGGGTPGVLSAGQIRILTDLIRSNAPDRKEFCFEIGRPETVTEEKLDVLSGSADRLCINCQTLNDEVLNAVGRRHTAEEFIGAVRLAQRFSFQTINVDLIAGLPGESIDSHLDTLRSVISLGVENITVHTLSIKRASTWTSPDIMYDPKAEAVAKMLAEGYNILTENGYSPYYIYRQKSTLSNGENVGYSKPDHIGRYNIYMMEDVHSVIGVGAGASTKLISSSSGRIDRICNMKYPLDYLQHPEKIRQGTSELALFLEREKNAKY